MFYIMKSFSSYCHHDHHRPLRYVQPRCVSCCCTVFWNFSHENLSLTSFSPLSMSYHHLSDWSYYHYHPLPPFVVATADHHYFSEYSNPPPSMRGESGYTNLARMGTLPPETCSSLTDCPQIIFSVNG